MGPLNFYSPNMLIGSIEFDMDLSQVACSCDFGVKLARMPYFNLVGETDNEANHHYCDADGTTSGDHFCPTFNILDANIYNLVSQSRKCDNPNRFEHYGNCSTDSQCMRDMQTNHAGQFGIPVEN